MDIQTATDIISGIMINKQKELDAMKMAVDMLRETYVIDLSELAVLREEKPVREARVAELEAEVATLKNPILNEETLITN